METYYIIVFFIFGTVLGSFYNVVGFRLPKGESIMFPASHCPNCGHVLKPLELIPIFSFLFLGRKCKKCKQKISWFYAIFEFTAGLLFALSYFVFGFSIELLIALTFISMLLIIVISDYHYMIIPDEILIISILLLMIEIFIQKGFNGLLFALLDGIISLAIMFLIKKLGDFLFKKESMGGGDIKLLFVFGLVLSWPIAVLSIAVASIIGLPISLILIRKKSNHEIPFGPFLSVGAAILLLLEVNADIIIKFLTF